MNTQARLLIVSPEARFDYVGGSGALGVVVEVGKVRLGRRKDGIDQLRQEGPVREGGVVI